MFISNQLEIPVNSLSCFIGRIDELDENFEKNGIMWVDFDNIDGSKEEMQKVMQTLKGNGPHI